MPKLTEYLIGTGVALLGGTGTAMASEQSILAFLSEPTKLTSYGPCLMALITGLGAAAAYRQLTQDNATGEQVAEVAEDIRDVKKAVAEAPRATRAEGAITREAMREEAGKLAVGQAAIVESNDELKAEIAKMGAMVAEAFEKPEPKPLDRDQFIEDYEALISDERGAFAPARLRAQEALVEIQKGNKAEALKDFTDTIDAFEHSLAQEAEMHEQIEKKRAGDYRRLGRLSNDVKPQTALEAYRKSTELDPSNFESWVYLARLEDLQAGDVVAATSAAKQAEGAASDNTEKRIALGAQVDLGLKSGALKDAAEAAQSCVEIARRQAYESGSDYDQQGLSVALNKLGDVAIEAGDLEAARTAFAESHDIFAKLAADNPASATAQRGVSVLLERLGGVAVKAGDLEAARTAFGERLELARQLAAENPTSAEAQRDLAVSYEKLGDVELIAGDMSAARSWFEQEAGISKKLMDWNTTSADARRTHSVVLNKLGDVAMQAGDLEAAHKYFEEDLEIARPLAADNPASAQALRDVSVSLSMLGNVAVEAGDLEAARAYFEEDLGIARQLAAENPTSAEAQRDVSVSLNRLGNVAVKAGDLEAARTAFTESLEIRRQLATDNPASAEAQRDLILSLDNLGKLTGDTAYWKEALVIAERLEAEGRLSPSDAFIPAYLRNQIAEAEG